MIGSSEPLRYIADNYGRKWKYFRLVLRSANARLIALSPVSELLDTQNPWKGIPIIFSGESHTHTHRCSREKMKVRNTLSLFLDFSSAVSLSHHQSVLPGTECLRMDTLFSPVKGKQPDKRLSDLNEDSAQWDWLTVTISIITIAYCVYSCGRHWRLWLI